MPPYSERVAESFDEKSLSEELSRQQRGAPAGDTPSPRTPSTSDSISPPPFQLPAPTTVIPIFTEDGIPHDYTLPHFIRQISGEQIFDDIQNLTLRVLTETSSLQQMSLYTPNLRELNLEGSSLNSLRDIGCELRLLEVLRIGGCRLHNLNGTLGLPNLRELYAARNYITNASPCAHLSRLKILDLSRNQLTSIRSLGFLSACKELNSIRLENNPVSSNLELHNYLRAVLPALRILDEITLTPSSTIREDGGAGSSLAIERQRSFSLNNWSNGSGISRNVLEELNTQPGPSTCPSISRLTSGSILCGNIAINRQKLTALQKKGQKSQVNIMRWLNAFYKIKKQIRGEQKWN